MIEKRIEKRNILLYFILSTLLFPIGWYWFYKIASDIKELKGGDEPKPVLHLIFGIITCGIFFWYCYYQYSKYIVDFQKERQQTENDIAVLVLVVGIFFPEVSKAFIQNELNRLAASQ